MSGKTIAHFLAGKFMMIVTRNLMHRLDPHTSHTIWQSREACLSECLSVLLTVRPGILFHFRALIPPIFEKKMYASHHRYVAQTSRVKSFTRHVNPRSTTIGIFVLRPFAPPFNGENKMYPQIGY